MKDPKSEVTELCKYPRMCPNKDHPLGEKIRKERAKKLAQKEEQLRKKAEREASRKNARQIPSSSKQSSTTVASNVTSSVTDIEIKRMFASFKAQNPTKSNPYLDTIDRIKCAFLTYCLAKRDLSKYNEINSRVCDLDFHSLLPREFN